MRDQRSEAGPEGSRGWADPGQTLARGNDTSHRLPTDQATSPTCLSPPQSPCWPDSSWSDINLKTILGLPLAHTCQMVVLCVGGAHFSMT